MHQDCVDFLDERELRLADHLDTVLPRLERFLADLDHAPARHPDPDPALLDRIGDVPSGPQPLDHLVELVDRAAHAGLETAGPHAFCFVPGGGLPSAAIGSLLTQIYNRHPAFAHDAPGLTAIEHGVLRWMLDLFEMPAGAGGILTTGGSAAAQSALHVAVSTLRRSAGVEPIVYVADNAHRSLRKAARLIGLPPGCIRDVGTTADGSTLDAGALHAAVEDDLRAGRAPGVVAATAGTTSAGTVDPLPQIAAVAHAHGLWLHVDACYGGFFQLTTRGRAALTGIARADSISLDPHKSLFLPFGTGALLVRDRDAMLRAHYDDTHGPYLHDSTTDALPNFAHLGPEMTRDHRGLRIWLPLNLHGVDAFRAALDEKLDLARHAHRQLLGCPDVRVLDPPQLSTVTFAHRDGDPATRRLLDRIEATNSIALSPTRIRDRLMLRLCIMSFRTHREHVDRALDVIDGALRRVRAS